MLPLLLVQVAISTLQPRKTPGLDSLSADFYNTYSEELVPHFYFLLVHSLDSDALPALKRAAVVVVVPKPV